MLRAYREANGVARVVEDIAQPDTWIDLVAPDEQELEATHTATGLSPELLRAALDEEERPRQEAEGGEGLIIISIPVARSPLKYTTIPLGIVVGERFLVTVCLQETPVVTGLVAQGKVHPGKKTRLLLQLLYRTASLYLEYLRRLDRRASELESALRQSMRNEEMFQLMEVQKSLVFLTTALRANQIVMEKLLRFRLRPVGESHNGAWPLHLYPQDEDLLEDAITENQQALSVAEVHSSILSGTMDAFASIISNNLNIVMKFLAAVTIILAIPSMVGTFFGMNVGLPLQNNPFAFIVIVVASVLVGVVATLLLWRRRML